MAASELAAFVRVIIAATRWRLAVAIALMTGLGLTSGAAVLLLVPVLQAAGLDIAQNGPRPSRLFAWMASWSPVPPSLGLSLTALVLATAAQAALNVLQLRLAVAINHDVVAGLRRTLFDRMCRVEWARFSGYRASDLLEALTAQADRVGYAARSVLGFGTSIVTVVVYVTLGFGVSPSMTALSLVTGGLLTALLGRPRRAAALAGHEQASLSKQLYASASDSLMSMKTLRAYGAEARHALDLSAIGERERTLAMRLAGAYGASKLWFDVAAVSLLGGVTFLAVRQLAVPAAELLVLLFVFMRLVPQIASLQHAYQNVMVDLPAFTSIVSTMRACESDAEPPVPEEPVVFERQIRLDRVTFAFADVSVLRDVSLVIPAGSTVAIVGPSGAGKSTLADLVLGLLRPREGRILIDGAPLTPSRMAAWRRQVGYVPQDTFLFHDSVRANLLWAAPNATSEELWSALNAAAAGFVANLPRGLDTVVGDRGVLLSGGERQRLAFARALLRRPKLLILDEATSSLDSENERVIEEAADALHGRVAILLITHRLSTVRHADMINVLDDGKLVEAGDWNELMAIPGGRFQALCRAQGIYPGAGMPLAPVWEQETSSHAV